jgi:glutaredoxin
MRAALLLLLAAALPASAQMYTWTDEKGVEHFSSTPPKDPELAKKAKEQRPDTRAIVYKKKGAALPVIAPPKKPLNAPPDGKVELYATSWCPACAQARAYFDGKGVAYVEYDIEKDADAAARFSPAGAKGVPFLHMGGSLIRGFSPAALDAALAAR